MAVELIDSSSRGRRTDLVFGMEDSDFGPKKAENDAGSSNFLVSIGDDANFSTQGSTFGSSLEHSGIEGVEFRLIGSGLQSFVGIIFVYDSGSEAVALL